MLQAGCRRCRLRIEHYRLLISNRERVSCGCAGSVRGATVRDSRHLAKPIRYSTALMNEYHINYCIDAVLLKPQRHQARFCYKTFAVKCKREKRGGSQEGPRLSRYLGANGVTGTKACRAGGAVGSICVRNCATSTASRKVHTGGESASSGVAVSTLRGGVRAGCQRFQAGVGGGAATCAEGRVRVV